MARSRRAAPTISERVGGVQRARAAAPRARNDSVDSGLISPALPPVYRTSPTVSLPERGDDDCEIDAQAKIAATDVYKMTLTMLMGRRSQATMSQNFGLWRFAKRRHIFRTQLR